MLTIDYTLILQIVNFLFLILLLNLIVFRPIRNILNKRKEEVSSDRDMIQGLDQKADKYSTELEANISDTKKKGVMEIEALKSKGMEEEQRLLKETYSMIQDRLEKAKMELEEKRLKAGESLKGEIKGFSTDLVEKFLGRGI